MIALIYTPRNKANKPLKVVERLIVYQLHLNSIHKYNTRFCVCFVKAKPASICYRCTWVSYWISISAPIFKFKVNHMSNLDGQVIIVTGGAAGIGGAITKVLVERGAAVVAVDINEDAGKAIEQGNPQQVVFLNGDVSKESVANEIGRASCRERV